MSGGPSRQGTVFQPLREDDPRAVAGYRLAARLGAGGMGKVYLSYTPGGRPVAIKVIRPDFAEDAEFRRRFAQEVHSAQRVQGLCTAPVIDADTDARQPWLATAYVPGPSLADAVQAHGRLPLDTVLLLTAGIAEALQVIHGAGIVHRDLKPANVLLAADGPRVIDFGIARAADATSLTGSGVTIGTPSFMAPEQAAGQSVTPATDIFALGQIAAYAAVGSPAFGEGTSHGVLYRIVHEEPRLDGLPGELRDLVTRCLAKDPAARPSVAEVLTLCQAANGETALRRPEEWLPGAVAADITTRAAAPAPKAATTPPPPAHAPAPTTPPLPSPPAHAPAPTAPPTGAPAAPEPTAYAAPAAPPPGFGPAPGTTPPPGFGPAAQSTPPPGQGPAPATPFPGYGPAPQQAGPAAYGYPHPAPAPAAYGYPHHASADPAPGQTAATATATTAPPAKRRRLGRTLGLGLAGVLTVAALAGGGVYYLTSGKDAGDQAKGGGGSPAPKTSGKAAPTAQDPSDQTSSAGAPSTGSDGAGDDETGGQQPVADPTPATYTGLDLVDEYHLTLGDDPIKPLSGEADADVVYDWNLGRIEVRNGRLILLRTGQKSDLETCRTETRYAAQVDMDSLSKGSQFCVLTDSGHIGVVTYRDISPESDPSRYVTLDVTVWRNAMAATDGADS
ncbi:serine/threonine-protein kinase [Streptomyces sp. NPDC047097]|uniref:serine/threonine-protein kinase n=1 Tax=Streptomyces sp. NPDC047097 TaxID=3155260 RepID=UPI0033CAE5F3